MSKFESQHAETIVALTDSIKFLLGEITTLRSQVAALDSVVDTVTPAPPAFVPAPAAQPKAPAAASAPQPPPPPPPPAPIAPSWATVTRRARMGKAVQTAAGQVESFHMNTQPTETYAQFLRKRAGLHAPSVPKASTPKRQQPLNTTPPLRPRRLIVKRDGTELTSTPMDLRDALNKVLGFTAVLSTQVSRGSSGSNTGHLSITLMESLLATKCYAKVGENLNTIPGAVSLDLDTPIVQMVVHGVPVN